MRVLLSVVLQETGVSCFSFAFLLHLRIAAIPVRLAVVQRGRLNRTHCSFFLTEATQEKPHSRQQNSAYKAHAANSDTDFAPRRCRLPPRCRPVSSSHNTQHGMDEPN